MKITRAGLLYAATVGQFKLHLLPILAGLCGVTLLFAPASATASAVVTNTADSGPGTLRTLAASAPGTITFAANLSGQTILLTNGAIALSGNLTIDASALPNGISINGNHASRIFTVNGGSSTIVLNSLTITNGYNTTNSTIGNTAYGGAILLYSGNMTLNNCRLVNNGCHSGAGALAAVSSSLTMNGTTVSGNASDVYDSAVYLGATSTTISNCTFSGNGNTGQPGHTLQFDTDSSQVPLSIVNSTFSGNVSGNGSVLYTVASVSYSTASVSLVNSTFSGNVTSNESAIYIVGLVYGSTVLVGMTNCTVVNNSALGGSQFGAINVSSVPGSTATLTLYNSIVSGNTSGGTANDIAGNATLGSAYNLIGVGGGMTNGVNYNQVGITNPLVAALGNYGGPTQTMPPLYYSPAIDAGGTVPFATDQRGFPRLSGSAVDIGAVESQIIQVTNTADSGPGSLRAAAAGVTNYGTIAFATTLSGQTITLTSGQLVLTKTGVTIDASALTNGFAINGNASSRIFQINSGAGLMMNALTLTNGNASGGSGGAIVNLGTLTVKNCTLAANTGVAGGAISNNAVCTLQNSTLYGNNATAGKGGAIENASGATLNLLQCTLSGNSTSSNGGGIDNSQGQVNVTNSIVAGNTGGDIYNGSGSTLTCGGSNIVQVLGNAGTVLGTNTILAVNPLLGPLTNNGGLTPTLLPQFGSPAINAGVSSAAASLATDQRGFPRVSGSAVDIGAVEYQLLSVATIPASGVTTNAATLNGTVNPGDVATTVYFQYGLTTNYGSVTAGVNPGNNYSPVPFSALITALSAETTYHFRAVASTTGGLAYGADTTFTTATNFSLANVVSNLNDSGDGSLRQAIARTLPGGSITFAANLSGQTILLTNGAIDLYQSVTIDASTLTNGILIDGKQTNRIFYIYGAGSVVLNSLTITNGYYGDGGGIWCYGSILTLNNCKLVNNHSIGTGGALAMTVGQLTMNATTVSGNTCGNVSAIYLASTATTIRNCTINGNSGGAGDAVRFEGANTALSAVNSTFSGNAATVGGYGAAISIYAYTNYTASVSLTNCTVVSNTVAQAGEGAIYFRPSPGTTTLTLYNTIVSGNTSGGSAADIAGGNAISGSAYNLIGVGGGLTNGVNNNLVGITNPLVAALGNYGGPTQTMPPLYGSPAIDAGGTVPFATDQRGFPRLVGMQVDIGAVESQTIEVTNTTDSGPGSLRAAVAGVPGGVTIAFATNLSGQTITLASGPLVLSSANLTIDASMLTNGVSINGNASSRIFQVNSGASAVLNSLTLTNGSAQGGSGGAIVNLGTLAVNNCTLAANTGASGGAISNNAVCTLQNSTIYGNNATAGNGGAIENAAGATLNLLQCTLGGNSTVANGGGIDNSLGQVNITNTIVAGNTGGDIYNESGGTLTCGGSNIVQVLGNAGTVQGANTILAVNPLLGPLANNGGPTPTLLPQYGSPAIDAGVSSAAASLAADQRGLPRFSGSAVDIGAVEFQFLSVVTVPVTSLSTNTATLTGLVNPGDVATTVYFQYGFTTNYGNVTVGINFGGSNSVVPFSTLISVSPGTTYHFRAVASNINGLTYGTDSSFGTAAISTFTSAAGLDLRGAFPYALSFGNISSPGLIGDANFTTDNVPGVTITVPGGTPGVIYDWLSSPNFGNSTDNLRLAQVMSSIRYTLAPGVLTFNLGGLQAGASYRLQMLFIERSSDRGFNVTVNGATIVPNFRLLDYGPAGTSIVIRYDFTATSTNALIQLGGGTAGTDHDPDMSGLTLKALATVVSNTNDTGDGSLRNAFVSAPPGGIITFAPNLSSQTITLSNGPFVLSKNVIIDGSMLTNGISNGIAINGNANSRIFQVNNGTTVTLNSLALTNGNAQGSSGGAIVNLGTLTVKNCTLSANTAAAGGAISNNGVCTLQNSTFYGNNATTGNGGAIENASSATLNLLQCTLSGNSTVGNGGGIDNSQGQVNITNTIIAGNTGGDLYNRTGSTLTCGGSNIVQALGNVGTIVGASTILAVNPLLGPLANNGGLTLTLLPQSVSPAINAGVSSAAASLATDQRGLPRLSGSAVDIGAVEFQFQSVVTLPVSGVTTNAATLNGTLNPGDVATTVYFQYGYTTNYGGTTAGINFGGSNSVAPFSTLITSLVSGTPYHFRAVASTAVGLTYGADSTFNTAVNFSPANVVLNLNDTGDGTLRQAIVSTLPGGFVTFASNLSGQTITLTNGQIELNTNVTIDASMLTNGLSINGNANSRIFKVDSGANVVLNALTLTNGNDNNEYYAGAILNDGTLALNDCTLAGNSSGESGAIMNQGSQLTLNGCTLFANTGGYDGAIENYGNCVLQNCTFYGNSGGYGGAIANDRPLNILQCTFSGNSSTNGYGAIFHHYGQLNMTNSIVAGNSGGDIYYLYSVTSTTFGGSNIVQTLVNNGGGTPAVGTNTILAVNPLLGPLTNNGGPTLTLLPRSGSPAIDAGVSSAAASLVTDQCGLTRVSGSAVDIGAVEVQFPAVTFPASGVTMNAATLNGAVTPNGAATRAYFRYGLTTSYGSFSATNIVQATNVQISISNVINGLTPNTTYYYQLVASNSAGTAFGAQMTFTTTPPLPPTVTTLPASNTTTNSATLNGTVNPQGLPAIAYFQYGLTPGYGSFSATNTLPATNAQVSISNVISGLTPGTTYYYQLVGSNSVGTAFGAQMTFTTAALLPPTVTTLPASINTPTSATLNGTVNPNQLASIAYFQYGLTTNYGNFTGTTSLPGTNMVLSVSNLVTGLVSSSLYHCRLVASNAVGTVFGLDQIFGGTSPRVFTGAAPGQGLDLQGSFLYAVNVGDNGAIGLIGDANFTADNVSGVTITTPGSTINNYDNWANPNFGTNTDGLRLTQVMSTIRYTLVPGILTINLGGLQVGASYQLQLLFIETYDDRVFNVSVNGTTIVPNFRLLDYGPMGTPIVIPYVFAATSTNALIQLGGGSGGSDNNPQISGFTLEALTPAPLVIGGITRAGTNLILTATNGVPGGGWTLLTTTNLTPPIIWSTNLTGTFDGQGNLTLTNGILPTDSSRYFIIRTP